MPIKEITLHDWDDPRGEKTVGKIQITTVLNDKIKDFDLTAIKAHGITTIILSKDNEDLFSATSSSNTNFKTAFDKLEEQMLEANKPKEEVIAHATEDGKVN